MTFSVGKGWEAQKKGTLMGDIYVRCPDCGQLSYDPRTGVCDSQEDAA